MTYLVYDLIIAALLLFFLWRGYKKGFVMTLCSFLAIFVAFIGATVVSNTLAEPVTQIIRPLVEESIYQLLEEYQGGMDFSSVLDGEMPGDIQIPLDETIAALKESPVYKGFAGAIQEAVDSGMVAAGANAAIVVVDYIARQVAHGFLFVVSFGLIMILWSILSHALDMAFRLPVLSTLNRWCGGVLGLAKGALVIFILCWLLKGSYLPQEAIQNSYLLNLFCTISPSAFFS